MKRIAHSIREHWKFVLSLCCIRATWYFLYQFVNLFPDSQGYSSFSIFHMFQDELGQTNPPVYGIVLDVAEFVLGPFAMYGVVIVQILLSFAALWFLYQSLSLLGICPFINKIIVLLYSASTATNGWDNCILTESFSLSLGCIILYSVIAMVKYPKMRYGLTAIVGSFILVFLRPQFLTYPVILLGYFILRSFFCDPSLRKLLLKWAAATLAGFAVVFLYCWQFQKAYGIFSLTAALPRQNIKICVSEGFYKYSSDPSIVDFIDTTLAEERAKDEVNGDWHTVQILLDKYGNPKISDIAQECLHANEAEYLSYLADTIFEWAGVKLQGYSLSSAYGIAPQWKYQVGTLLSWLFDPFTVMHALVLPLMAGIAAIVSWVRHRTIPWIQLGLFALGSSVVYPVFITTNGEFVRTMIGIVPFLYIWSAMLLQWISNHSFHLSAKKI